MQRVLVVSGNTKGSPVFPRKAPVLPKNIGADP